MSGDSLSRQMNGARKQIAAIRLLADSRNGSGARPWDHDADFFNVSIIEFATDARFLGVDLFPRQGTLLKIFAAQPDTFTAFDNEVIDEWTQGFTIVEQDDVRRWVGLSGGIVPDVRERIAWLNERGAPGFSTIVGASGRRGGKSKLAAINAAYRLWQYLGLDDVQAHFGIDPNKPLQVPVVSSSLDRAIRDQFRDLLTLIVNAPCFEPFIISCTTSRVQLTTPAGLRRALATGRPAPSLIELAAVETSTLASRGPAVPIFVADEVAHLTGAGSTASFEDILASTVPATLQFRDHALIWMASSPSTREGQFYDSFENGMTVRDDGTPLEPGTFTFQLASPRAYDDWERAHEIERWPGGPTYAPKKGPIIDEAMVAAEEAKNPETTAVELRANWAEVLNNYLPAAFVGDAFADECGRTLTNPAPYNPAYTYVGHADPSVSQANFGLAIAHLEPVAGHEDVFYDVLHSWNPRGFDDGRIYYPDITDQLFDFAVKYRLERLTMDHFNSAGELQRLQKLLHDAGLKTIVEERREYGRLNWEAAETFKSALGERRIHAPRHALAEAELRSLQVHGPMKVGPSKSGRIRTADIADCMIAVYESLHLAHSADQIIGKFRRLHRKNP